MEHRAPDSTSKQLKQHLRKKRRTQWMIASTWVTTAAAFVGFFTVWNHLSNTGTAAASASGSTPNQGTSVFSTNSRHHHDGREGSDDGGFGGGNGYASGSNGYSSGSNGGSVGGSSGFGSSGSVQVNPGGSSGQFVTRAS